MISETIFEVETEPAIVHCSTIIETVDSTLLCVWYQGSYETAKDTVLKISRCLPGETRWTSPEVLFDFRGAPLGNPVLWSVPGSARVYVTFSVLTAESWETSLLFYAWSEDSGSTWSPPALFISQPAFMGKTKPIPDGRGGMLFPLYHETDYCPFIMLLDDPEHPIGSALIAETMARKKAIQPALHRIDSNRIIMLCRTNQSSVWRSISFNNGYSWSILRPTSLPNPDSAIDLFSTQSGGIGIVYNPSATQRDVLAIAETDDGGENWNVTGEIVRGAGEFSYPFAMNGRDGSVMVSYTDNRYAIRFVRFGGSR